MEKRSIINPIENIRLSSELWRENIQVVSTNLRRSLINLCDRILISQINFIDRMKINAEISANLSTKRVSNNKAINMKKGQTPFTSRTMNK
ncbi:hypothetical protein X466_07250 [Oenococcus oeni S25]|uniref:hypothetical protein n=2 Tax=Oenococcus oeni TaxID=1247 RepID=UPI00050E69A7|nr:hypothetical protein [Oenococcus oeni]KGO16850.1 hypothetical protein OA32_01665 [Oenococcus oeni X2L]KGH55784.1 hypothetical protein X463_05000 [Oenococcus oeni S22]KGH69508.1 hypothetical protein X466_07250 [Oenococcus oeni S25]KGH80243.1 hypothetical protein X281_05230 [Oenococcus oeni IOEB_0607]KGH90997.1 hypothetical protein X296_00405 [Oenococcus oeni IOEB_L26_1]